MPNDRSNDYRIPMRFSDPDFCTSGLHCKVCRFNEQFRKDFGAPEICPHGITDASNGITFKDKLHSLATAATDWVKAGIPITPEAIYKERFSICQACEFWNKTSFGGTGSCSKCGCSTAAKLKMATSKCPIYKWQSVK